MHFEARYQEMQTWYSIHQFTSWFSLQTSPYDVIFVSIQCRFSVTGDVMQKVQRHHDLIKTCGVKYPIFIRSACKNVHIVNMRGD